MILTAVPFQHLWVGNKFCTCVHVCERDREHIHLCIFFLTVYFTGFQEVLKSEGFLRSSHQSRISRKQSGPLGENTALRVAPRPPGGVGIFDPWPDL